MVTILVFKFCQNLSFWVVLQFEFLSYVTIWVFEFFLTIWVFEYFHNFGFWVLSQFELSSFVFIWFFCFCHKRPPTQWDHGLCEPQHSSLQLPAKPNCEPNTFKKYIYLILIVYILPLSLQCHCLEVGRDVFKGCLYTRTYMGHRKWDTCNHFPTAYVSIVRLHSF